MLPLAALRVSLRIGTSKRDLPRLTILVCQIGGLHENPMASSISSIEAIACDREVGCIIDTQATMPLCNPQMKNSMRVASSKETSQPVFSSSSIAYSHTLLQSVGPHNTVTAHNLTGGPNTTLKHYGSLLYHLPRPHVVTHLRGAPVFPAPIT